MNVLGVASRLPLAGRQVFDAEDGEAIKIVYPGREATFSCRKSPVSK